MTLRALIIQLIARLRVLKTVVASGALMDEHFILCGRGSTRMSFGAMASLGSQVIHLCSATHPPFWARLTVSDGFQPFVL
jgi:hypothetical protein